jgi:dipeptidyl aminopeptidase/acylaminoacyl peptidase
VEGTGTEWSPDSTSLLYLQAGLSGELPYSWIDQVNVETRQVQRVLGDDSNPEDYSVPAWSPDGEWAAVGQRLAGGSLTRQLWLVRLGNGQNAIEGQPITDDVLFTHGGYQWEPGGSRLVYQRLAYGESDSLPQVAVWNRLDRQTLLLAEDSFQPFWQP